MFELKKVKKKILFTSAILGTLYSCNSTFSVPFFSIFNKKNKDNCSVVNENVNFEISEEGILTGYIGNAKEVVIPENVKIISFGVFMNKKEIEKITLPESLEIIDEYAFYGCKSLKEIRIPDKTTTIKRLAFGKCMNLEKIHIGKSFKTLEKSVFFECKNLKSIDVDSENENFSSHNGILYSKDFSVLKKCPANTGKKVKIHPETTSISSYSFANCENLEEISRDGDKPISIYDAAFYECKKLKKLNFEDKIEKFGPCVFTNCISLTEFKIGEKVKSMGDLVFFGCKSLKKVIVNAKDIILGHKIFDNCNKEMILSVIKDSSMAKYAQKHWINLKLI